MITSLLLKMKKPTKANNTNMYIPVTYLLVKKFEIVFFILTVIFKPCVEKARTAIVNSLDFTGY